MYLPVDSNESPSPESIDTQEPMLAPYPGVYTDHYLYYSTTVYNASAVRGSVPTPKDNINNTQTLTINYPRSHSIKYSPASSCGDWVLSSMFRESLRLGVRTSLNAEE